MVDEWWEKLPNDLIDGYWYLDFTKENPQCWCLEVLDGVGAHLNNIKAL